MSNLYFQPVDEPDADNPDYDDTGCQCPPGDNQYLLELEEGGVVLVHATCGKQPPANWVDWTDLVSMGPIPVTVQWEAECDGSRWHGMDPCDHGSYIVVTATSVPEDVRTQALELSRKQAADRTAT